MTTRIYVEFDNEDSARAFLHNCSLPSFYIDYGITDSGYLEEETSSIPGFSDTMNSLDNLSIRK